MDQITELIDVQRRRANWNQPKPTENQPRVYAPARPNVQPSCPECQGARHIRYEVEIDDPRFGRLYPCPACNAQEIYEMCGLSESERSISFDDIETQGRPGAAAMLSAANVWISGGRIGMLSIHGGYGNGKTTLLKAIVNDGVRAGVDARYITMTEVMVYAREAFDSTQAGDSDYGRIARLAKTQVLVIDEVDKARLTEYTREVQTHLFDYRYRHADTVGTVVAWNGEFEAFALPWVRSRLSEGMVVRNADADMRPLLGATA